MDATTNDLSPKVIDRSCIIKVTKDAGETLCPFEQGVMTWEEMQGEDSFEKQLLKALKKDVSNRVERQRVRMRETKEWILKRTAFRQRFPGHVSCNESVASPERRGSGVHAG